MKHILASIIIFLIVFSAPAKFVNTDFYSEDFHDMIKDSQYPGGEWLTYGNGAQPNGGYPFRIFGDAPEGVGSNGVADYVLMNTGLGDVATVAFANTMYANGVASDQWLITPEIEMPYDVATVTFDACGYNANGTSNQMTAGTGKFSVLVSDSGTEKGDFKDVILEKGTITTRCTPTTPLQSKTYSVSLNGYEGRRVRIAFVVNNTEHIGFVGFTNIVLGQYALKLENNLTEPALPKGSSYDIKVNLSMRTPVVCNSLTASLKVDGNVVTEDVFNKTFGSQSNYQLRPQMVEFENAGKLAESGSRNWELIITPDFEGAIPSVVSGTIAVPEKTYPNNVFVEEVTATGCPACPAGMAAMRYYADTYPGGIVDGNPTGKFIGVALHGYINHSDPMAQGIETYLSELEKFTSSSSYPNAAFNRKIYNVDPCYLGGFERLYAEDSYNFAKITKVEMPENADVEDMAGAKLKVHFEVTNGYTTDNRRLNAAVILIENNVTGGSDYSQSNGLSTRNETYVQTVYGDKLLPYMADYISGGKYGTNEISCRDMTYNHVARSIFPSFNGEVLAEEWSGDVPREFDMEMIVPETVMDFKETEAIVIILDGESKRVVASDIMPASQFVNAASGVESIRDAGEADDISVANVGGMLCINSSSPATVTIYAADGRKLALYKVNAADSGKLNVAPPGCGVLIVKVATRTSEKATKLLF